MGRLELVGEMKKLLALLFLPSLAAATYIPVNGSTLSCNVDIGFLSASTTNPVPVQSTGTTPVSGTFWQTTQPISVAVPYTVILTTSGANASTTTVVINGQPTIANTGFNVNNTPAVTQSGGPWTVIQTTGPVNASTMTVVVSGTPNVAVTNSPTISNTGFNVNNTVTVVQSTSGANASTMTVVVSGTPNVSISNTPTVSMTGFPLVPTGVNASSVAVVNGASNLTVQVGNTQNTVPIQTISTWTIITDTWSINVNLTNSPTVTANAGTGTMNTYTTNMTSVTFNGTAQPIIGEALVSSMTLRSVLTDATTASILVDWLGRLITADIPVQVITTTSSQNASPGTAEYILISSATAPARTYMCGCIFMNNSATNTGFTLYQSTSSNAANAFYPIGAPANYVPTGIRPDCGHPFFWSVQGGEITIKPSATATSTLMNCTYFQK